ncbi:hypothetical protein IEQ34_007449 [Dendrobium chrysotoxum]|uniref:Uncharacterized protein n=1 Tax=Dendrobium chrysotoxum TaxID=161865 RepID=A0AAV7HAR4_DENCH|nr:hypothetical protein IEQ34_007449 [Dendrobium chrysotoxum]
MEEELLCEGEINREADMNISMELLSMHPFQKSIAPAVGFARFRIYGIWPKKRSKGCDTNLHSKRASAVDFLKEVEEGEEEHGGEEKEEEEEEKKEEEEI